VVVTSRGCCRFSLGADAWRSLVTSSMLFTESVSVVIVARGSGSASSRSSVGTSVGAATSGSCRAAKAGCAAAGLVVSVVGVCAWLRGPATPRETRTISSTMVVARACSPGRRMAMPRSPRVAPRGNRRAGSGAAGGAASHSDENGLGPLPLLMQISDVPVAAKAAQGEPQPARVETHDDGRYPARAHPPRILLDANETPHVA
jgi:hypothetical protein